MQLIGRFSSLQRKYFQAVPEENAIWPKAIQTARSKNKSEMFQKIIFKLFKYQLFL